VPGSGVAVIGPVPDTLTVGVEVGLAPRDVPGLDARLALEYTPGSPDYRHFLDPTTVAERFGPDVATYDRAVAYFADSGLNVIPSPDRLVLHVEGSAPRVAAAFHTTFTEYRRGDVAFYSHPTAATLPGGFGWSGAVGLGNESPPHPFAVRLPSPPAPVPLAGCPTTSPFAPCAVELAYNFTGFLAAGTNGSGVRMAVVDTYDGAENQTELTHDLATFSTKYGLPAGGVQFVYPVPTSKDLNRSSTGWGLEAALDVEWAHAMAPGATLSMTLAPDASSGLYAAVDWLVATHAVDVVSLSWGEPDVGTYNSYTGACVAACNASSDGSYTLLHPVLVDAAIEGIGVFAASGDCGAAYGTNGLSTGFPASDPTVTGMGGTFLSFQNGTYVLESGWSGNATGSTSPGCANQGGSGGGFAPFPRPVWQSAPGVPSLPATRGVPDLAAVGSSLSPVDIVIGGATAPVGGTSVSSPIGAGFAAIADDAAGGPLGNLNAALYAIARGSLGGRAFHDPTAGWNGYSAGPGWDPVTGLGTPDATLLIPLLTASSIGPSSISVFLHASPRSGPAPLVANLSVVVNGGTGTYPIVDIDFGDGNATLVTGRSAFHTYPRAGVFVARATVVDSSDGSATSAPLGIVVGGGAIAVDLNASSVTPAVGAPVTLTANLTGGTGPYTYWFAFGDGTYADAVPASTEVHRYAAAGGYCVGVVAADNATPRAGGSSNRVAVAVGGAALPACDNGAPLTANFSSTVTVADLPGDLPLTVTSAGGVAPISVRYVSDDPYVGACNCGVFRIPGDHTVTAFINDSLNQQLVASLNVTLYPALAGFFTATNLTGPAPFSVGFTATPLGGSGADANQTTWTFGDGGGVVGAQVNHTYLTAGLFVVLAVLPDAAGGTTSAAFLVDVTGSASGGLTLGAEISPAVEVPAGDLVTLTATPSGGTPGYVVRWDLGDNDSAFGPTVRQTFGATACVRSGACPLVIRVSAADATGANLSATITLPHAIDRRSSAVVFTDAVGPAAGTTPLHFEGGLSATGVTGLTGSWTFGDGAGTTGTTIGHTYFAAGNYTVTETVVSPWGDQLERTHAVTVTGPPAQPPSVSASATPSSGLAPLAVVLTATASNGTGPYAYAWTFGDGTNGSGAVTNHTFGAGNWSANVTVTDALGDRNTSTVAIVVYAPTVLGLALTLDHAAVGPAGVFTATIWATPRCAPMSVPGCGPSGLQLSLVFRAADGTSGPLFAVRTGPQGSAIVTLEAPSVTGAYRLNVTAATPGYVGAVDAPITVLAGPPAGLLPLALDAATILGLGVIVGIATAIAVGPGRRAEPEPASP